MKTTVSVLTAVASLLLPLRSPAQSTIPWAAIDMGFVISSSPTTMAKSVVGQGFVGMTGGTNRIIEAGFLVDTLFRTVVTSVAEKAGIPKEYALHQNYPNPFNPSTTIQFELPHASDVSFKVYNVLGQEVLTLVEEEKPAGVYNVQFSAENLASGMYVYRLQAGDFVSTKKLIFLK